MIRSFLQTLRILPSSAQSVPFRRIQGLSSSTRGYNSDLEEEVFLARKWAASLNKDTMPRKLASVRFDRSSGKGGQHVNTTSSKATCTWTLNSIADYVPRILLPHLRSSTYYAPNSDSLVIQSQAGRKQHDNEIDCHEKLYRLLRDASKKVIPGEISPEQKAKVEELQKLKNMARLRLKKEHSAKKQARRGGSRGGPDY